LKGNPRMNERVLQSLLMAALGCALTVASPAAGQQAGAGNLFDGEWKLSFYVDTPPGGVVLPYNSPYHMHFRGYQHSFRLKEDGTFALPDGVDGGLTINTTVVGTTQVWERHQALLKASGKATAVPTPPGSPQPYERSLVINLDYTGGSGMYGDNRGGGGVYIVDAAGEQMTVTGLGPTTTHPVTYWKSKWELKPDLSFREEVSPDVVRETTGYSGVREAEVTTNIGKYKVTERIQVMHVRYLGLVPRDAQGR